MTEVVARRNWRAEDFTDDATIFQTLTAFGWTLHRSVLPVGNKIVTKAATTVTRSSAASLILYVRGRASLTHENGTIFDDRVAGMYSGDRPDTPAGVMTHEVIEELEFWCFNWHVNRGALPALSILRLADGETFNAPVGQRVIVCTGALGAYERGMAFVHDASPLVASGTVYGFLVEDSHV